MHEFHQNKKNAAIGSCSTIKKKKNVDLYLAATSNGLNVMRYNFQKKNQRIQIINNKKKKLLK
jgi:hypothetical protein